MKNWYKNYVRRFASVLKLSSKTRDEELNVRRFASVLKLSSKTQDEALKIIKKSEGSELISGRSPAGIAAAGLYIAALLNNEKRTQIEIADVAGITEVTIKLRYKGLLENLSLEEKLRIKEAENKVRKRESKSII